MRLGPPAGPPARPPGGIGERVPRGRRCVPPHLDTGLVAGLGDQALDVVKPGGLRLVARALAKTWAHRGSGSTTTNPGRTAGEKTEPATFILAGKRSNMGPRRPSPPPCSSTQCCVTPSAVGPARTCCWKSRTSASATGWPAASSSPTPRRTGKPGYCAAGPAATRRDGLVARNRGLHGTTGAGDRLDRAGQPGGGPGGLGRSCPSLTRRGGVKWVVNYDVPDAARLGRCPLGPGRGPYSPGRTCPSVAVDSGLLETRLGRDELPIFAG